MKPCTFEELSSNEIGTREERGVHVDHCTDCPFACEEGDSLYRTWQAAYSAAKREYDRLKAEGIDPFNPDGEG